MITQQPAFTLQHVELSSGIRMHYAQQGDSTNPPLILLHGLSDSWFSYSRVLPALATNYCVYALDQRGHGDTDRPTDGYTMRSMAADVVAFLDALGLPHATVFGHSMGSVIAIELALAAPERLQALVLIGANTSWDAPELIAFQQVVDALEDPISATFVRDFQASTAFEPLPAAFMDRVIAESLKLPAHVWRGALAGAIGADYASRLGSIQTQTLVIGGEDDAYCPPENQRALAARIPNAEIKLYAQLGHCPHWERPEAFIHDVERFLATTDGRTGGLHPRNMVDSMSLSSL
jgi:non-heme chloroperoxidase